MRLYTWNDTSFPGKETTVNSTIYEFQHGMIYMNFFPINSRGLNTYNIQNQKILLLIAYNVLQEMKSTFILYYNKLKFVFPQRVRSWY